MGCCSTVTAKRFEWLVSLPRSRAGRLGRVYRALRLPALGCAMAVKALALIWELAQMDFLTIRDIERGFRVLKSEIEIGPIYHRLPARIHAHASICFMALILYRVMRTRLGGSSTKISPERALEKLRRIQHQRVKVNDLEPIAALSSINQDHTEILQALTIKKPALPAQLTLL